MVATENKKIKWVSWLFFGSIIPLCCALILFVCAFQSPETAIHCLFGYPATIMTMTASMNFILLYKLYLQASQLHQLQWVQFYCGFYRSFANIFMIISAIIVVIAFCLILFSIKMTAVMSVSTSNDIAHGVNSVVIFCIIALLAIIFSIPCLLAYTSRFLCDFIIKKEQQNFLYKMGGFLAKICLIASFIFLCTYLKLYGHL